MKKLFLSFAIIAFTTMTSCSKSDDSTSPSDDSTSPTASSDNKITDFFFTTPDVKGTISKDKIDLVVPPETNITNLIANFVTTGISVKVDGKTQISGETINNFTTPLTYIVMAENGTEKSYTVQVRVRSATSNEITDFFFTTPDAKGIISGTDIAIIVPFATDITNLVASFVTTGISVKVDGKTQISGETINNFTTPLTYIVTAENGTEKSYTVTISREKEVSEHTITLDSNNRVASLLMTETEYNSWIADNKFNDNATREALFKDIYKKFKDDFDFIFLILNEGTKPAALTYAGQLISVSNTVTGIGITPFNNAGRYGSAGKLKSVMILTKRNYLETGPSLHELAHTWGNFGITTAWVPSYGTGLTSFNYIPHWGFTGGSTPGQLGGFRQSSLVENGGNSYTVDDFGPNANGANGVPYNDLELYLMGMIPISEVANFDVFENVTAFSVDETAKKATFTANKRTTHTPATLQALLGDRTPSSATSQKDFKLLIVVLTKTPLTDYEWSTFTNPSERFGREASDNTDSRYNFWEATRGKGTMTTGNLQNSLK